MVTIDNYEEYLMMAADGELDAAGEAQLKAFLLQHPELAAEAESWTALKMQPDPAVVYEEKESLLRQKPKSIALGWRVSLAAAASVALALVLLTHDRHQSVPRFAHNWSQKAVAPVVKIVPDTTSRIAAVTQPAAPKHKASLAQPTIAHQMNTAVRQQEELVALNAAPRSIQVPTAQEPAISPAQTTALNTQPLLNNLPETSDETRQPFIHVAAANAPALELIKEGVDERVSQITKTVKSIRETAFAVRIGNKNHYLNF
jgi:anti-sigma factor RsiW